MVGLVVFIVCCFLGFIAPKSKYVAVLISIYMWVLFGFNLQSPDWVAYERIFIQTESFNVEYEPGFTAILLICKYVGFSYQNFRLLIAMIYVFFTFVTVKRCSSRIAFTLALNIIAPFLWYISGLRIALASIISCYSLIHLFENTKKSTVMFIFWISIATLFHYSAALYLVILLSLRHRIDIKYIISITIFATILTIIVKRTDVFYLIMAKYSSRQRTLSWFINSNDSPGSPTVIGALVQFVLLFGNIIMTYLARVSLAHISRSKGDCCLNNEFGTFVYNCNCAMLYLVPLIILNLNFMRPVFGLLLLNECSFSNAIEASHKKMAKQRHRVGLNRIPLIAMVFIFWTLYIAVHQEQPYINTDSSVLYTITKNLLFPF